jgi:hypothetical protein
MYVVLDKEKPSIGRLKLGGGQAYDCSTKCSAENTAQQT